MIVTTAVHILCADDTKNKIIIVVKNTGLFLVATIYNVSVFPLKLGKRGKYRALVCEYRTKLSELCIKDYVNTSPKTMDVNTLPT